MKWPKSKPHLTKKRTTSHHQIFDLSHDYHETMPVGDGGGPPEISLVELEEENGLR